MAQAQSLAQATSELKTSIGAASNINGEGWVTLDGMGELFTLFIAVAAAFYSKSQRDVAQKALAAANGANKAAIDANTIALEANRIAEKAQDDASIASLRIAEMQDSLNQYNRDCADGASELMVDMVQFPSKMRLQMEMNQFDPQVCLRLWLELRQRLVTTKEAMRREMRAGHLPTASFTDCFTGERYDALVRSGSDLHNDEEVGRLDRLERLEGAIHAYDDLMRSSLLLGRTTILERYLAGKAA